MIYTEDRLSDIFIETLPKFPFGVIHFESSGIFSKENVLLLKLNRIFVHLVKGLEVFSISPTKINKRAR